jgi:diguanylate cyclase (GGDEF)-like protein
MKRLGFFLLLLAGICAAGLAAGKAPSPKGVNFSAAPGVLTLKDRLAPYHAAGVTKDESSRWYMLDVTNDSVRPAIRVLTAGQGARAALRFLPHRTRPQILAIAASDSAVAVERADAYGPYAWRVFIPPVTSVGLAIRVTGAAPRPELYAWSEPALAAHNRQLAIFITAVAALISATIFITGGLAILIGHAAPRWVALTLFLLLMSWLSGTGLFDATLATSIGGPYGFSAFLNGLALTAGARLADAIVPLREIWPRYHKYFGRTLIGLVVLSALAYLGVPGTTVLTDVLVVIGSAVIAAYLLYCGRRGRRAAQVIAPSATAFALVALAAAVATLGGLGEGLIAPAMTGGFASAGAVLLALAVIASEEIAVLPFLHGAGLHGVGARRASVAPPPAGEAPLDATPLLAIEAARQGIFDLNFEDDVLNLSQESSGLIQGAQTAGMIAHSEWIALVHPEDREIYCGAMQDYRSLPGQAFRLEFRARDERDAYLWFELRATMLGEGALATRCLGMLADVTQRKEGEAVYGDSALVDPLTGLGSRVALMQELDGLGPRFGAAVLALLDIDRFKAIHASLGDEGGDAILCQSAKRLGTQFPAPVKLFRVGGDSFALLALGGEAQSLTDAQSLGDAMVEACAAPYPYAGRNIFAPVSVGVALGADSEDPLALIAHAERALGEAKRQGGAFARLYSRDLEQRAPGDAVALEADLRRALEEKQLDVFYQPIVRLSDRAVAGFEALLRWHHPARGLMVPAEFIAHSEETGLIVALGRFVLARAAQDLARWQKFFPLTPPLFVSVNFSRRQLRDGEFERAVGDLLASGSLAPATLKLEITESAAAGDGDLPETLSRLRALGAGLAIDDFGTGTSSLSRFRELPFDTVKIDKSFLNRHGGTEGEADSEKVLSSMVSLAHDLGRAVVVEGVESQRDADWLAGIGCEFGQGYYFAAPLPAGEALHYIALHFDAAATRPVPPVIS